MEAFFPANFNFHPFPPKRNLSGFRKGFKTAVSSEGSLLWSPDEILNFLLKPEIVFGIDFYHQGCSACVASIQPVDWVLEPGCTPASQSQLMIFATVVQEQMGAAFMELIPWVQENGDYLFQFLSWNQELNELSTHM